MIKKINYRKLKAVSASANDGSMSMSTRTRKAWVLMAPASLRLLAQETYPFTGSSDGKTAKSQEEKEARYAFYNRIDQLVSKKTVELSKAHYSDIEKVTVTIHVKDSDVDNDGFSLPAGRHEVQQYQSSDIMDHRHFVVEAAFDVLENFEDYKELLIK